MVALLLPIIYFLCDLKGVQSASWPTNSAALSGHSVTMSCSIGGRVNWSVCVRRDNCREISRGEMIVIDDPEGRYSISLVGEEYQLTIDRVLLSDSGSYLCDSWFGDYYGELIVLDDQIACDAIIIMSPLVAEEIYSFPCRVPFKGRWAPSMHCSIQDYLHIADNSTIFEAVFIITFRAKYEFNGGHMYCEAYFEYPKPWEEIATDEAGNIPAISGLTWTSLPLDIVYSPRSVAIAPDESVFEIGQMVTCSSLSNPLPSYKWYDARTGAIVREGPKFVFRESDIGIRQIRCEASNIINGNVVTGSVTREVVVCDKDTCQHTSNNQAAIVGSVLGILLAISIIIILVLLLRPRFIKQVLQSCKPKQKGSKHHSHNNMPGMFFQNISVTNASLTPQVDNRGQNRALDGRPSSSILPNGHFYHYISDDDVISVTGTQRRTNAEPSGSNYRQQESIYEPVAFRNGGVRNDQTTADRNMHNDTQATPANHRPDYSPHDTVLQNSTNQDREQVVERARNLTFRDDTFSSYLNPIQRNNPRYSDMAEMLENRGNSYI